MSGFEKILLAGEKVQYSRFVNVGVVTMGEALRIKPFNIKNKTPGTLVITNKRVFHYSQVLFNTKLEQINLENINNIESKGGLIFTVIRLQSNTNVLEIDFPSSEAQKIIKYIGEMVQFAKSPVLTPAQNPVINPIEKIKQLGELKDKGILTEEEFNKKKEELLKQI